MVIISLPVDKTWEQACEIRTRYSRLSVKPAPTKCTVVPCEHAPVVKPFKHRFRLRFFVHASSPARKAESDYHKKSTAENKCAPVLGRGAEVSLGGHRASPMVNPIIATFPGLRKKKGCLLAVCNIIPLPRTTVSCWATVQPITLPSGAFPRRGNMFDQDAVTVIRRYLNSALRCLPDGETLTASGLESARDATKTAATLLDASHKLVAAAIYKVMDPPIRIELPPPGEALFDGLNPAPAALVKTEDPHRHPLQRLFNFLLDEFLNQYWPESDCLLNESVQSERDASEANWTRRFDNDFDSGRESVIGELHHEFSEMNELPDFENETGIDLQLEFQRACELLGRAMRAGHQAEEDIEEAMTSWRESWDRAPEDREENFRNLINLIAIEVEELEEEASDTPPEITWENGPSLPIETVTAFPPPDSTTQPGTRVYVDLDGTAIAMPADGSEGGAV